MKKTLALILTLALSLAALTGCGGSKTETPADTSTDNSAQTEAPAETTLSGSVSTNGSTSMEKVIGALSEQFMADNSGVTVTYDPTGSGAGIEAATNGSADIGLSSRALKDEETANGLTGTTVALDGIAVIVNAGSKVENLTVEQIGKIFTGEITDWSEVGGDAGTISCIGREAGSLMRIVVKVGTSTLAYPTGRLNIQRVERMCKVLSDLKNAGHEIILVSSGAIAMGFGKLNLRERPKDMPTKQASAAVGQCELMYVYDKLFTEYNHTVAQLLITAPDIADGGSRKENFHNTLDRLLELGALPVINENDTISTEEIAVGDNDTLSAVVAATVQADLLILLSDIEGLYDSDPHRNPDAKLIGVVPEINEQILSLAGGSGSNLGTGGMVTKLRAAQIATEAGCEMVIANGWNPDLLYGIAAGESIGTRFLTKKV